MTVSRLAQSVSNRPATHRAAARSVRGIRGIRGFTLIELLLVLVILAVLAGLVVPRLVGQGEKANKKAAETALATIGGALNRFEIENGRFPTSQEGLHALMEQPAGLTNWGGPYLSSPTGKDPTLDPWGNAFTYASPGSHNKDFDLSSSGPNGQPGDDDDIVNWQKN